MRQRWHIVAVSLPGQWEMSCLLLRTWVYFRTQSHAHAPEVAPYEVRPVAGMRRRGQATCLVCNATCRCASLSCLGICASCLTRAHKQSHKRARRLAPLFTGALTRNHRGGAHRLVHLATARAHAQAPARNAGRFSLSRRGLTCKHLEEIITGAAGFPRPRVDVLSNAVMLRTLDALRPGALDACPCAIGHLCPVFDQAPTAALSAPFSPCSLKTVITVTRV